MKNLLTILLILCCTHAQATNYYVDMVSGSDGNLGTSTGSAWRSIAKVNSSFTSFASGDSILFRRGQIFYGCIRPTKTFAAGNPLKFSAYGSGAKPVITGLIQIDSWTAVAGQTNLWEGTSADSANLPGAKIALNDCNLVLINGVNTQIGRYPNADAATPWLTVASHTNHTGTPKTGTITSSTTLPAIFTKGDVVTKAFNFAIVRHPIISQVSNTITYLATNLNVANNGWGFFIQNDSIATVLDQQNEWWYSPSRKKLRMYSVGNPNTLGLNVKIATLDTLVYIYSSAIPTYNNYTFNGIDFIGSNRRTFFVADADNVTIKNSTINFCGLYAFWGATDAQGGETSQNLIIDSCIINNVNSQGIVLSSHYVNPYIGHSTIKNTGKYYGMFKVPVLNDGENSSWAGAFGSLVLTNTNGATVEYNVIDSSGYNGITFLGNNIKIHHNEVMHHNLNLQDGAGIYSQGYRTPKTVNAGSFVVGLKYVISVVGNTNFQAISLRPIANVVGAVFQATGAGSGTGKATTNAGEFVGCKIYNNIVHHGLGNNSGTNNPTAFLSQGIYCDENTTNTQVYNNTCFENASYGIFSNSNRDCSFTANTCYGNRIGQVLFSSQGRVVNGIPEMQMRDTSKNNIFVSKYIPTATFNWKSWCMDLSSRYSTIDSFFTVLDSNIYARPINDGLSPLKDTITIRIQLNSFSTFAYDKFSMWKTYASGFTNCVGKDAASVKSPRTITNIAQLSLIYNPTDHDSTVILSGSYVDIRNVARSGSVVLTPYTSMVLISTGSQITPVITWSPSNYTYGTTTTFAAKMNASTGVAGTYRYFNGAVELFSSTVLNAGTYSLTVNFTPTDGVTYTTATKTNVPLTVSKKQETLAYTVLSKVYTGSPLSPTVTISPDAGVTGLSTTYDGLGVTPTNVKAYAVITGLTNINYSASSISGTFNITKATATISITNLAQVFDNTPKNAAVTTTPAGLTVLTVTYTGISGTTYGPSTTAPTLSGTYNVGATLTNSNYNTAPASATMTISPSGATISLVSGDLNTVYSGANKTVRAVTNPIGQPYTVSYVNTNTPRVPLVWNGTDSVPRFAGTYNVTATVTAGGSQATGVLTVTKLTPIITWATPAPITVGTPLSATQLNATVNVASGTKIYRRSNGVQVTVGYILSQGNNAITMTFTPTNSANINTATKTVTISVTASLFGNEINDPPLIENK